jgi:DNA polymerase
MTTKFSLIEKYFSAQKELCIPNDIILENKFVFPIKERDYHKVDNPRSVERNITTKAENHETSKAVVLELDKREELAKLYYRVIDCKKCSLYQTRNKFVFGTGTAYTDVMVIGEAPGEQEDLQGKPFVGAAGDLLTKMLAAINIERKNIFIANILKCRPPMNRTPNHEEVATCIPLLRKQIEIIKPKALLLLGRTAANGVLQNDKSVGALRGTVHYFENIPTIVSYHPSALLRDASWKKPAWQDLQKFERLLKEIRNGGE